MEKLIIGEVVKPQGIKGELKIKLFDTSKDLSKLKQVYIGDDIFAISSLSIRQDFMYVMIEGFNSIQEVEKFRMQKVYINVDDANQLLDKNEYFVENILNFNVITSMGGEVGVLDDVQNYGSKDVAFISGKNGQILLPIVDGLIEQVVEDEKKLILNAKLFLEVACYEDWYFNAFSRDV